MEQANKKGEKAYERLRLECVTEAIQSICFFTYSVYFRNFVAKLHLATWPPSNSYYYIGKLRKVQLI